MLGFLRSLRGKPPAPAAKREAAPAFPVDGALSAHEGFPVVDWSKVLERLEPLDDAGVVQTWSACERAWLLHFRDALGSAFRLDESDAAALVSSLEPGMARAALEFMARTERRIGAVLQGIVEPEPWARNILILFDDEDGYYRYASRYYPESGEFAGSGGMHLNPGCSHFIAVKSDLRALEATIVHEMAHASLRHLSLPLWLSEGLAVNTERRLAGAWQQPLGSIAKRHERMRRFWSAVSIQAFWSGESFDHPGDSNELSYELARVMVEQLGRNWEPFARFVRGAKAQDAGAAAARECLNLDLGEVATALLERDTPRSWAPDPTKWEKR